MDALGWVDKLNQLEEATHVVKYEGEIQLTVEILRTAVENRINRREFQLLRRGKEFFVEINLKKSHYEIQEMTKRDEIARSR